MKTMTVRDQMDRRVEVPFPPRRIVSLVPSQTELLATLGLDDEVVGITKFCVHPESWFREKQRIGGTKKLHIDRIEALQPDLIIGNKEENERTQIEALANRYPVWMSDIYDLSDALDMIGRVGRICNREVQARELHTALTEAFSQIVAWPPLRTLYLIWNEPIMAVGQQTFIHNMLDQVGLRNALTQARYPALSEAEVRQLAPELILLSSEPFPFGDRHIARFRELCPDAVIMKVNGELFSWYGSRLLQAPAYFNSLRKKIRS